MTPRELAIRVQGEQMRMQNQWTLMVEQALLISRWVWKKRISHSEIEKITNIEKRETKKEMTDDEMLRQVKAVNALFGGEVKIIGAEK